MNAERLNAIVRILKPEASSLASHLRTLVNALSARRDNPQDTGRYDKEIIAARTKIQEVCEPSAIEKFPMSWKQFLNDHSIWGLLGNSLESDVEAALSRYQSSIDLSIKSITAIRDEVVGLDNALTYLQNGFTYFSIESDQLKPGECEIGFIIPRSAVNSHLFNLGEEFEELNRILGPFAEIAEGGRPPFEVRSISASDYSVFITTGCAVVAAFSSSVKFLLDAYKSVLEIKKLRNEIAERGLPDNTLTDIDDYADKIINTAVEAATQKLFQSYPSQGTSERRNELNVELKVSLVKIARRIDEGYGIEVRAEPPANDNTDGDANAKAEYFATIGEAQESLNFLREPGQPVLQLPMPDSEDTA